MRQEKHVINKPFHIGITSVNFDARPEGICTGRLVRALLNHGFKITLVTSRKSKLEYAHPRLKTVGLAYRPRNPKLLFKFWAKLTGSFENNFFLWSRRALKHPFDSDDIPDIFYGRAWPYASLVPAYYYSKRYRVPFIAHLSDPIPPPNEAYPGPKSLENLQAMLDYAKAVTFTNEETVEYQGQYTPIDGDKTHVLPHVSPGEHKLPPAEKNAQRYYHIGAIGNRRPALYAALEGFKLHLKNYPHAHMNFVNPKPQEVQPVIRQLSLEKHVSIFPFAPDIRTVMTPATALISYEPNVETPIWTLTKTIEYLCANRCIFALTSKTSPTEKLLRPFPESCVVVNAYDAGAIAEGYDHLAELAPSEDHFAERLEQMADFKAENVARKFEEICESILNLK